MTKFSLQLAAFAFVLSATRLHGQSAPTPTRGIIVLDPAHGGAEAGARITDNLAEKDFNLSFTARLKPLLAAAGFTVITTRDNDPAATTPLTPDQRAGIANHAHALACLLIHATPSGSGVHLYTSTLTPSDTEPSPYTALPWDTAQSAYLPQSIKLATELGAAFTKASIPPTISHAPVRPLDNLTCPAVAIELAPLSGTPITDTNYQQRLAKAITDALISWRTKTAPPEPKPAAPAPAAKPQPAAPSPAKPATANPAPTSTPAPPTGAPR